MGWLFQTGVCSTGTNAALTSRTDVEVCDSVELPSLSNDTGIDWAWSVVFWLPDGQGKEVNGWRSWDGKVWYQFLTFVFSMGQNDIPALVFWKMLQSTDTVKVMGKPLSGLVISQSHHHYTMMMLLMMTVHHFKELAWPFVWQQHRHCGSHLYIVWHFQKSNIRVGSVLSGRWCKSVFLQRLIHSSTVLSLTVCRWGHIYTCCRVCCFWVNLWFQRLSPESFLSSLFAFLRW